MPKIDHATAPVVTGTRYPAPHDAPCRDKTQLRLSDAAGLTQFGVHRLTLAPGSWSSQRHWHSHEDEFVYVLSGTAVLVTDDGETLLGPGDCAGFRAGDPNGHCLQNRSPSDVVAIVVGGRHPDDQPVYPDIDMALPPGRYQGSARFTRKDGTPY